jgi:AcrR family transcriptional regulator
MGAMAQPRRTQAERRALSERRLLDAAVSLIAEQGSSRTTLAEVGERAGYSRGLVNQHFGSKSGLVAILTREIQERFRLETLAPALEGRSGLDALLAAVDAYLDAVEHFGRVARAFYALMAESVALAPEIRPTFANANGDFRAYVERWIRQGIERGEIRPDVEPAAQAALLVGTLRGVSLQRLVDPKAFDVAALRRELRESLERSLRAPSAPA